MIIRIAHLAGTDYDAWMLLARGYKAFYQTGTSDAEYEAAWRRLLRDDGIHAFAAWVGNRLVGIAHYLFHTSTWTQTVCYLQDLYVDPAFRGQGVARTLIETVATAARDRRATRLYWLTQAHNTTARVLYDKLAKHNGFIRYDFPAGEP